MSKIIIIFRQRHKKWKMQIQIQIQIKIHIQMRRQIYCASLDLNMHRKKQGNLLKNVQ